MEWKEVKEQKKEQAKKSKETGGGWGEGERERERSDVSTAAYGSAGNCVSKVKGKDTS